MKVKLLLAISILSLWFVSLNVSGAYTDPYIDTGNIIVQDSPYAITYTWLTGPNSDMLKITIENPTLSDKSFFSLENITNTPLDYRGITYSSGSGFYAGYGTNAGGSGNTVFYSNYSQWYDFMLFDMPSGTYDTMYLWFYIQQPAYNQTLFLDIIRNSLVVKFDTSIDLQSAYDIIYNTGYDRGASDYGYIVGDELLNADEYASARYNTGYDAGLAQADTNALAIRNMIPGILGVTFAFFFQLASISFLGITALDLIAGVITIAVAIFVIRIFLNR